MSGGGQFWVMNGDSQQVMGEFAANGASDPQLLVHRPRTRTAHRSSRSRPSGTFNTQAGLRNTIHNPGFQNWNIGLFKKFAITETDRLPVPRRGVQRCSITRTWAAPTSTRPTATFGKITGKTGDVRNLQLSLRFYF